MKLKNISETDFARRHPGGQIGRRLLLNVDDVMRKDDQNPVITVDRQIKEMMNASPEVVFSDDKAVDALEKMKGRNEPTAIMPVLNRDNKVVGMIHLHDLISAG